MEQKHDEYLHLQARPVPELQNHRVNYHLDIATGMSDRHLGLHMPNTSHFQLLKLKTGVILDSTPNPIHQYILLALSSKYIQNLTASHYLHCYHPSLGWNIWIFLWTSRIIEGFPGLSIEVTHAYSGMLEPAHTSSQEPTRKFSVMLQDSWYHGDSMNLAMVGIFTPQILANFIKIRAPLSSPLTLSSWSGCSTFTNTQLHVQMRITER